MRSAFGGTRQETAESVVQVTWLAWGLNSSQVPYRKPWMGTKDDRSKKATRSAVTALWDFKVQRDQARSSMGSQRHVEPLRPHVGTPGRQRP